MQQIHSFLLRGFVLYCSVLQTRLTQLRFNMYCGGVVVVVSSRSRSGFDLRLLSRAHPSTSPRHFLISCRDVASIFRLFANKMSRTSALHRVVAISSSIWPSYPKVLLHVLFPMRNPSSFCTRLQDTCLSRYSDSMTLSWSSSRC